jgi:hypothetical protein
MKKMKKLFVAASIGLVLASCGGKDEKAENAGPSVCDCVNAAKSGKMDGETEKKCNELQKTMNPQQLQEEAKNCK